MKPAEIERMARLEEAHWWYRGLRDALARVLATPRCALPRGAAVLDAGCGSGANLELLQRLLAPAYLGGFDASPLAVELARRKVPGADVYLGDVCAPEIRRDALDLVLSADVVCIPGTARARPGLERLVASLRPGGLLVLHLPAYGWMFSEHDVAVGTTERTTRGRVRALLESLGLAVELAAYRVSLPLPAIVLARAPTILGRRPDVGAARSDVELPGRAGNALLTRVLALENAAIARGVRFPCGSSVLAVGRRP
jgi:SAM-dependent methyltransferase